MKRLLCKKVSSVFLAAIILFLTVYSLSVFSEMASAATDFTPRTSAPASSNKYYYSDINIFYKYGYGMPNCTAYAYGRAYEILGSQPKLCSGNAEKWYDYNISNNYYSYGSTAKLGAIACWKYSGGGHVAVVEKIENTTITFSNSAWGGSEFYLTTAKTTDANAGGNSSWTFQGYIYIGDFVSADSTQTTESSSYSTGIYKTNVISTLNMRSGAGTSYDKVASIGNGVLLTVTKVRSGSDGYTWGYTSYNTISGWVALDYCDFISESAAEQKTTSAAETTESTAQDSENEVKIGDVNGDGVISIIDVTEIQKYLANLAELSGSRLEIADFNGDGCVSILDATQIQKYLAGLV